MSLLFDRTFCFLRTENFDSTLTITICNYLRDMSLLIGPGCKTRRLLYSTYEVSVLHYFAILLLYLRVFLLLFLPVVVLLLFRYCNNTTLQLTASAIPIVSNNVSASQLFVPAAHLQLFKISTSLEHTPHWHRAASEGSRWSLEPGPGWPCPWFRMGSVPLYSGWAHPEFRMGPVPTCP